MYKFLTFLFFTICTTYSQENVLHFTIENGLPHDITYGIFQDKEGYIWIGTDDGLVKYDGQDFKLFSTDDGLRTNFIIDIKQNKNGDILLATWGGGLQIIRDDKVLPLKISHDEGEKINNLQLWNDNIVVKNVVGNILYQKTKTGYEKKLLKVINKNIKVVPYSPIMEEMEYVNVIDNNLYFFNDLNFLYNSLKYQKRGILCKGNRFEIKNLKYFKNKIVNNFAKIDAQTYFISVKDSIFLFNKDKFLSKEKLNLNSDNFINKILKYDNQFLVLISNTKGYKNAFLYTADFKRKIDFAQRLDISTSISDFLIDHEDNIWISTFGSGIYCIKKQKDNVKSIKSDNEKESNIVDIKEKKGINYILSANYLTLYKDKNLIKKIKLTGLGKKMYFQENGNIQISSVNINSKKVNGDITEFPSFNNFDLKERKKIIVNDSILIEYYKTKIPRFKRNINDAVFYKDTLWFATNVGMYYYEKSQNRLVKKNIGNIQLLSENIKKFEAHRETLWIATNKGLCSYFRNTVKNYTHQDGLISNHINTLLLDHREMLWIGTNKGVSILNANKFINISTNKGLVSTYINVIFEDSKKQVWIGTDKGISIFDNTALLQLEEAPILNVKQYNSKFYYSTISYNRSNSLIVEYSLNSQNWILVKDSKGILNFKNENKGDYILQLRAKKQDGKWVYSKKYKFSISIPWYKDPVYIVLFILLLSLVIILVILRQLKISKTRNAELKSAIERQLLLEKELTEVRENIAQDFHDDLGNKLARISLLSNLANEEISTDNEKLKYKMVQIENDANYLYRGTKDFIFSLKEQSNYLEELATYLTDFGQDLFNHSNKKFIVIKEIENNTKLPYYWSKQLIYIFKEAFTNVYKHSNGDEILFKFSYINNCLEIVCSDNGNVFSDKNIRSNGLSNMKRRAEKLGVQLIIEFSEKHGTTIKFRGKTT